MSSGKPRQLGRKGTWKQPKLSQNKKFAIISSLDTSRPVTYSHRPSGLPKTQHHIASRHHPLNQTLSTFSQSSFQQCIIDYDKGEPSDTTNPRSSLDLYESSEEILTEEDRGEKGIMKVDIDMTKIIAELDVDLSLLSSTESHFQSSAESQTQSRSFIESQTHSRSFIESQTHSKTSISDTNTQSRASLFEVHSKTTQTETHPRTTPGLSDDISTVRPHSSPCTSPSSSHISHETVGVVSLCNQEDVQRNDCTFSEYLAYSKEPLSLADVLNVQSASLTTRPPTKEKYKRETDTRSPTTCQKPTFNVLPASIHQFCAPMTSYPQLPLQLQILSHKSHTRPVSSLDYNKTLITQDKVQSQVISGDPTLTVCGVVMPVENDPMGLLWASSPPKLALYPLTIKQQLCPQYIEEAPVTENTEIDVQDRNEDHIYNISLSLISESTVSHTSNLSGVVEQEEEIKHVEKEKEEEKEMTAKKDSYDLYKLNMSEVAWQREQLIDIHKRRIEEEEQMRQTKDNDEDEDLSQCVDSESDKYNSSSIFTTSSLLQHAIRRAGQKRRGVSTPAKTRLIRKTKSALMRTQYVRLEVSKPARQLKHSLSYPSLSFELDKSIIIQEPIKQYRHSRSGSLPSLLDFDALFVAKGQSSKTTPYKWAESLWDQWFYEVLAEVRAALAELNRGRRPLVLWQPRPQATSKRKEDKVVDKKIFTTKQSSLEKVELAAIPSLVSLDNQMFQNEVEQLTNQIEACKIQKDKASELAEYLSQRGSLYRKYGELKKAINDCNEALSLSKSIVHPHWERHLLYLIQGEEKLAADELTVLLKKDRKHILAFISKASLLAKRGELSDAIQNYTQAIWLESDNPRLYFLRAELREKRGEIEAAVSDYATVVELQPHNEEALIRQAKHKFNKNLWRATTQTLTSLLTINHSNTEAWLLRSQAQLQMGNYEAALQDLSAAIHLNPTNATLFYQRGCLLRGHNPERALHDFSISVLLDSSKSNAVSFLYRGIVYTEMKCYDEALKDFLTARQLDMSLASAHANAGLVIMNYHNNSRVAVKHFTAGLLADPTYIRALLCRAEAFTKLNKLQEAILDWSRAIHMYPSDPSLHLNQGKVHLLLEDYTNAIGCIRTASKLDSGVGSSPDQKALVHSFLGEHQEAIAKLYSGVRGRNNAHLHTVLGKVQLRARMFSEAAASFREALKFHNQLYPSSNETQALIIELHFLCGQSLLKAGQFREASEEFGRVIMSEPNNVMAHYYRGVSLLKLGHNRGMMSISRALVLKSDLVKGYLTRAAYYGQHNRLSKAILNCSEAIRLQPKSVRAYLYRGVLRHQMGYHDAAIADLSIAISLSPTHSVLALYNRAICHHTIGNIDQALNDYSVVCLLEDTPNYRVMVNRGLLYLSINDYHNALSDFTTARNVLSHDPLLWQATALCYHKLGNLKDAIKCYSQALKLDSSFTEAYIGRANVYTEYLTIEGNQKAKVDYISVLHQYPNCFPARINLALLLQCEGHYMLSWKQLTCILAIEKDYPPALEARAIISLQMGNTFGALLDISRALTLHSTAQYFTERGAIHHYTGDVINAVRDYEKAIQLDSTYILAQYNFGNILLQQRLYKQGIDKYSKVLALVPEEDGTLINRALCYIAIGERDLALQDLNKAISSNPFAAHAYFNRANILRAQEKYQEAEQDYRQALELQPLDSLTLNYHGDVLGLLGERDAAREQFIAAAQLEI